MALNPRGERDKFNTLAVSKQGEGLGVMVKNQTFEESAPGEFESTCSRIYFKMYSY